ncbi:MAG: hypothetical protein IPK60_25515 [Sandaracinaceae bacterium]|nr:hypothetical protein [Sandaracinaceae bacterium]
MNKIISPLNPGDRGDAVADLHDGLALLLKKNLLAADNAQEQKRLLTVIKRDRVEKIYGDNTVLLVKLAQQTFQLEPSGSVDEKTARVLNERIGGFDVPVDPVEPGAPLGEKGVVSGQVLRDDGLPLKGATVRVFHATNLATVRLGEDSTDEAGRYTIVYAKLPSVDRIDLRVSVSRKDGDALASADKANAGAMEVIDLHVPATEQATRSRRIEGRVLFDDGRAAEGVKLRLMQRLYGAETRMLAEALAREEGLYSLPYDLEGKSAALEIRAVNDAGEEIPLTKVFDDVGVEERIVMNLLVPSSLRPLASEFQRLVADVTPHVGNDINRLADARENVDRKDLTVLNRATGWDARLIATAATATRKSHRNKPTARPNSS